MLKEVINQHGKPDIFNTDQGVQFTCEEFMEVLQKNEIKISMDGKSWGIDNIFIEWFSAVSNTKMYIYMYMPILIVWYCIRV